MVDDLAASSEELDNEDNEVKVIIYSLFHLSFEGGLDQNNHPAQQLRKKLKKNNYIFPSCRLLK